MTALEPSASFDPTAPLPAMPDYRSRSWEPAARHYRDLTEDEKAAYRPREWEQEGAR